MRNRSYRELIHLPTFEERFKYLSLEGVVAEPTFGSARYVNQRFYRSREWLIAKDEVIYRDNGCDLGIPGREIHRQLVVHHINPVTVRQILDWDDALIDPQNLITTSLRTHNAIHYGDEDQLLKPFVERRPGDTDLWPSLQKGS